jgi:hypothetical protein
LCEKREEIQPRLKWYTLSLVSQCRGTRMFLDSAGLNIKSTKHFTRMKGKILYLAHIKGKWISKEGSVINHSVSLARLTFLDSLRVYELEKKYIFSSRELLLLAKYLDGRKNWKSRLGVALKVEILLSNPSLSWIAPSLCREMLFIARERSYVKILELSLSKFLIFVNLIPFSLP